MSELSSFRLDCGFDVRVGLWRGEKRRSGGLAFRRFPVSRDYRKLLCDMLVCRKVRFVGTEDGKSDCCRFAVAQAWSSSFRVHTSYVLCTLLVAAGMVRRAALPKGKGNSATIRMSISMGPRYRFLKKRESDLRSLDKLIC